jgi:hypothetical protein
LQVRVNHFPEVGEIESTNPFGTTFAAQHGNKHHKSWPQPGPLSPDSNVHPNTSILLTTIKTELTSP